MRVKFVSWTLSGGLLVLWVSVQVTIDQLSAVLQEHIAQRIFPPVTVAALAAAPEATAAPAAGAGSA